jgi:hypothetical protein
MSHVSPANRPRSVQAADRSVAVPIRLHHLAIGPPYIRLNRIWRSPDGGRPIFRRLVRIGSVREPAHKRRDRGTDDRWEIPPTTAVRAIPAASGAGVLRIEQQRGNCQEKHEPRHDPPPRKRLGFSLGALREGVKVMLRLKRGAGRSRTDDGGFAIRCLSHLATAPCPCRAESPAAE